MDRIEVTAMVGEMQIGGIAGPNGQPAMRMVERRASLLAAHASVVVETPQGCAIFLVGSQQPLLVRDEYESVVGALGGSVPPPQRRPGPRLIGTESEDDNGG